VKPSALEREHPVLKNMKILDFFLFLWVIFSLLDPDPDPATQTNVDPDMDPHGYGSGSETLIFSTSTRSMDMMGVSLSTTCSSDVQWLSL
jgi:hypothetical protein